MLNESLVVIAFVKLTPVSRGERNVKSDSRFEPQPDSRRLPIATRDGRNMGKEANAPLPGRISFRSMNSGRRFIVTLAFAAAIAAVVILNAGAAGNTAGVSETIHLREVAHASGIDFVHQEPTLDPAIANVAPHVGALGACVSVADVNNDGGEDLH